jgi:hypothetical protein
LEPFFTSMPDCSISTFTSDEALAADWASRRTSTATTAKPLPASPARAASTEALSAKRLVWKAMSSISPMMFEIFDEGLSDAIHRSGRLAHHLAALFGGAGDVAGKRCSLPWRDQRFCSTVVASCSIAAEVFLDRRRLLGGAFGEVVRA